jgi:yeast amino acid transporter
MFAIYSYAGTEIAVMAADETSHEVVPKVVRRVSYRVTSLYVAAVLVLGLTVSSNDPLLGLSSEHEKRPYPGGFVIMAERDGKQILAQMINMAMILAIFSAANINLYVTVCPLLSSVVIIRVGVFMHCLPGDMRQGFYRNRTDSRSNQR